MMNASTDASASDTTRNSTFNFSDSSASNEDQFVKIFTSNLPLKEKVHIYLDFHSYKCVKQLIPICFTGEQQLPQQRRTLCVVCAQTSNLQLKESHYFHCLFRPVVNLHKVCKECNIPLFTVENASSCEQCTATTEDFFKENPRYLHPNVLFCEFDRVIEGEIIPFRRRSYPFNMSVQIYNEE